ncbi:phosphatidate cytidylyltransferase [Filimonas effusa]|uniref:Phosphatidate cytidylyltransferase n=1 Tax=Filimonas effusa TaxID=2508721 RepID=A0A4Q1D1E2_9BACT|nr:phosphatidate cytidylyltransferase [Filimonas effusa]RXK80799.1 phosphatidate cytidylyltransferase [Filimonas effusa]
MAFNSQVFKTRALTAVIFAAVMLAGLLVNQWTFFVLFSVIHAGCWLEYQKLVGEIDPEYQQLNVLHKYGVIILGWGFMMWMTGSLYHIGDFHLNETGWWIFLGCFIAVPVSEILFSRQFNFKQLGYSLLGFVYISLSWGLMMELRSQFTYAGAGEFVDLGWVYPVVLIASIWINDTMAYIVGSFIGKTPFSPISPKKTWEGTAGGAILAVVAVTLGGYYLCGLKDIGALIGISTIGAVFGTIGDLLESKLKRMAGVKDSGSIMPGHGGFLDRFDSLLLATPFAWLFLRFFI